MAMTGRCRKRRARWRKTRLPACSTLHEGGRGEPDDIAADLAMKSLDLDGLMSALGHGKKKQDVTTLPLQLDLTGVNLAAQLASDQVTLAAMRFSAVTFDGRLAAGDVTLRALAFALAGGTVNASGSLQQAKAGGHLALTASLTKAEADALAQLLGAAEGEIRGRLDGGITLDVTGKTLGAALKTGRGASIMTMNDGEYGARTDREGLGRSAQPVPHRRRACARQLPAGRLDPQGRHRRAIAIAHQLARGDAGGRGQRRFRRQTARSVLKTDHDTTGFFALDVPIVVKGPFTALRVTPLLGADEHRLDEINGNAAVEALPAALQQLVRESACVQ